MLLLLLFLPFVIVVILVVVIVVLIVVDVVIVISIAVIVLTIVVLVIADTVFEHKPCIYMYMHINALFCLFAHVHGVVAAVAGLLGSCQLRGFGQPLAMCPHVSAPRFERRTAGSRREAQDKKVESAFSLYTRDS